MIISQKLCLTFCSVLLLLVNIKSETIIRENISAVSFVNQNSPFIVETDIFIPPGKSVVIEKGCVFLFKPFTGLTIYGSLTVNGTKESRVVFTTINDTVYSHHSTQPPEPFAWNGITIGKNAVDVSLHFFDICYPVYGIKSQRASVVIDNGLFHSVGQYQLTIDEQVLNIDESIPFFYNTLTNKVVPDSSASVQSGKNRKERSKVIKYIPEIVLFAAGLGGAGVGTNFILKSNDYAQRRDGPRNKVMDSDRIKYNNEYEANKKYAYYSYGGSAVCVAGAIVFAVVHHKDNKKLQKISLSGRYSDKTGTCLLTYRF